MPEVFEDLECACGGKTFKGLKSREDGRVELRCRQCGYGPLTYYDGQTVVDMLIDSLKNPRPVAQ